MATGAADLLAVAFDLAEVLLLRALALGLLMAVVRFLGAEALGEPADVGRDAELLWAGAACGVPARLSVVSVVMDGFRCIDDWLVAYAVRRIAYCRAPLPAVLPPFTQRYLYR